MKPRTLWLNLGWLVVLVVTFAVPLILDGSGGLTYFTSLTIWAIPILYLWPVFRAITAEGTGRRRRALRWTIGLVVGLGIVLDFLLGHLTLRFPGCEMPAGARPYLLCLPGVGAPVPIEELLFYAMGPIAIVLVYACADELWLNRYNPKDDLLNKRLLQVSRPLLGVATIAGATTLALWRINGTFPTYFAFLSAGALLPAIFLYRCIGSLTNWPAFAVTALYVIVTSVVWEVTLAIPREWWGYNPSGMSGVTIAAWSRGDALFPIEAAFVWLATPFSCILTYEFAKALAHHPSTVKVALFGPGPDRDPTQRV